MKKSVALRLAIIASVIALLSWGLGSCTDNQGSKKENPALTGGEGYLPVAGGNIWYKVSGKGTGTPVVLIHGGPGSSSYYLKPLEALGDDRPVVRYDQLGSGKSTYTEDTALFHIIHFVQELDSLRKALGIDKWHLIGHSWGTIIALEYYIAFPDNVTSLTFAGACFNMPAYAKRAAELLKTLPDSLQQAVMDTGTSGDFENPLYLEAMTLYNDLYISRKPVRADVDSTMATYNAVMYVYMQGPSEFTITGTLKDYDATGYLHRISVPTLFTVGEFDSVGPELVKSFAEQVRGSLLYLFPEAAHITMWDAGEENTAVVRNFLRSVDGEHRKQK